MKVFSKILYNIYLNLFKYETEIVTFHKILTIGINAYALLYSLEGGRKDKTKMDS